MAKTKVGNQTTAMTKYDERFAALAKQMKHAVSKVGGAGQFISLRGGIMTWQGAAIPENKMRVIVLDAILENQYYEGTFDPDNFAAPVCYAHGRDPDEMAPNPENVETPVNETCTGCPNNQWGSADVGKGKACREVQRLALITEKDMDNLEEASIAYMKVPVTSVKGWAGLVRQLDDVYHKPPLAFVIEISLVKEQTNKLPGWHLEFKMVDELDDPAVFDALFKRYEAVSKEIFFPYPKTSEAETEEAQPKKRAAKPRAVQRAVPKAPEAAMASAAAGTPVKVGLRRPVKAPKF